MNDSIVSFNFIFEQQEQNILNNKDDNNLTQLENSIDCNLNILNKKQNQQENAKQFLDLELNYQQKINQEKQNDFDQNILHKGDTANNEYKNLKIEQENIQFDGDQSQEDQKNIVMSNKKVKSIISYVLENVFTEINKLNYKQNRKLKKSKSFEYIVKDHFLLKQLKIEPNAQLYQSICHNQLAKQFLLKNIDKQKEEQENKVEAIEKLKEIQEIKYEQQKFMGQEKYNKKDKSLEIVEQKIEKEENEQTKIVEKIVQKEELKKNQVETEEIVEQMYIKPIQTEDNVQITKLNIEKMQEEKAIQQQKFNLLKLIKDKARKTGLKLEEDQSTSKPMTKERIQQLKQNLKLDSLKPQHRKLKQLANEHWKHMEANNSMKQLKQHSFSVESNHKIQQLNLLQRENIQIKLEVKQNAYKEPMNQFASQKSDQQINESQESLEKTQLENQFNIQQQKFSQEPEKNIQEHVIELTQIQKETKISIEKNENSIQEQPKQKKQSINSLMDKYRKNMQNKTHQRSCSNGHFAQQKTCEQSKLIFEENKPIIKLQDSSVFAVPVENNKKHNLISQVLVTQAINSQPQQPILQIKKENHKQQLHHKWNEIKENNSELKNYKLKKDQQYPVADVQAKNNTNYLIQKDLDYFRNKYKRNNSIQPAETIIEKKQQKEQIQIIAPKNSNLTQKRKQLMNQIVQIERPLKRLIKLIMNFILGKYFMQKHIMKWFQNQIKQSRNIFKSHQIKF